MRPRGGTCPWPIPTATFTPRTPRRSPNASASGTGGEIEIVVHGGGSLFKGNEIKRAVQTGQAPIGERLLSAHENENALFGFDSIPFLATSYEASDKLWEAARPTLEEILDEQNLVLLYAVPWPPQGIYAKKELDSADDLAGRQVPLLQRATARMAELMGAVPVQIEEAELSQALATGVADSFISSGATGYDRKVWEQRRPLVRRQRLAAAQHRVRQQGRVGGAGRGDAAGGAATAPAKAGEAGTAKSERAQRLVQGAARRERHERRGRRAISCAPISRRSARP